MRTPRHLADAAVKAVAHSTNAQRADLDDDELLRLALTKLVEIVGEAAAAARMRDRLVHHYFDINLDILWQTLTEDLPRLVEVLPVPD